MYGYPPLAGRPGNQAGNRASRRAILLLALLLAARLTLAGCDDGETRQARG